MTPAVAPALLTAAPADPAAGLPAWVREVDGTLAVHAHYLLYGNVHDAFLVPAPGGGARFRRTVACLVDALRASGWEGVLVHDPVTGLRLLEPTPEAVAAAQDVTGRDLSAGPVAVALPELATVVAQVSGSTTRRVALVLEYASRLVADPVHLGEEERAFFTACLRAARTSTPFQRPPRPAALHNPVVWLCEGEGDLPAWFTSGNDAVRLVPVPLPDFGEREAAAELLVGASPEVRADQREEVVRSFAESTEGMRLSGLLEVGRLARDRGLPLTDVADAARAYRVGFADNPWRKEYLRERLRDAAGSVAERVRGQEPAVLKTLDILKRAALGLSGAQAARSSTRPRGVLFFAGPTGTGKTELAKTLTELVFGDERAYVRFDMSEFSAEHADARLIGAPPGFIGYEGGGELTNAVRSKPFSLVLFDEVEKAHPRILDKFLQVLEDGRLTDGSGRTVHFSETLLVFTSNLGMMVEDEQGRRVQNADPSMPPAEVRERILTAVRDHFTLRLGRPELLNRLGDNIVVFDFIRPDVAADIFALLLANVVRRVEEQHGTVLELSGESRAQLLAWCTADLQRGGRGIGMALESLFVDPLARALFELPVPLPSALRVRQLRRAGDVVTVELG